MDELVIRTAFAKKLLQKAAEQTVKKILKRKISFTINDISINHGEGRDVFVAVNVVANMTEAELAALVEQIGNK